MKRDDKFPDKNELLNRFKQTILPLKSDLEDLNNQVFKARVPSSEELDFIKPIETKVTPIEPKNIRVPPAEAQAFAPFYSEKVEALRSSLQLFVSNKREHINKTYFDLKEKIRQTYVSYGINIFRNYQDMQNITENPSFKSKHGVFRELNGGKAGYEEITTKVRFLTESIDSLF